MIYLIAEVAGGPSTGSGYTAMRNIKKYIVKNKSEPQAAKRGKEPLILHFLKSELDNLTLFILGVSYILRNNT